MNPSKAVLLLLVNVVTAGAVELTADFSKKVSNLTTFWNGGGWDNEQVVDPESEKHNWMFDIDPKNTMCIYQQEQIVGTIPAATSISGRRCRCRISPSAV